MSAGYTNLRTVSYRDTIAELLDRAKQTHTRATGVQVFSPGDGMAYEDSEGFINPISPALFDEAKSQIAEASEALVTTEAELEAAQGRIDETTELLGQLDEQAVQTAADVTGVIKDMAADRLRLDTAESDLEAIKPALGNVELAVEASDKKATAAETNASTAASAAETARKAAVAAEARVAVLAASAGSLIVGGGFEQPNPIYDAFRVSMSAAHGGSYGAGMKADSPKLIEWSETRAGKGQVFEVRLWARLVGSAGNYTPVASVSLRMEGGTTQVLQPTSASIRPALSTTAWSEYVFRFDPAPEGTLGATFRTGVSGTTTGTGTIYLDDVVAYDTFSYEEALTAAVEAKAAAEAAAGAATAAASLADQALTSANGKATIRHATTPPQGVGLAAGDVWWQWDVFPGGVIVGQWTWDGTAWQVQKLSHQTISSVDLGKATVGQLKGSYIEAGSIESDRLTVGGASNGLTDPGFQSVPMAGARAAQSVGQWTRGVSDDGTAYMAVRTAAAQEVLWSWYAREGALNAAGGIPVTGGQQWSITVDVNSDNGTARVELVWWNAKGVAATVPVSDWSTGPFTRRSISGSWTAPVDAVAMMPQVRFNQGGATARRAYVYGGAQVRPKAGAVHIEDGAITATKVNAESVAGAIGQFVKVQAENVEVTDTLAARVLSAATSQVATSFVTDRLVVGTGTDATVLEVLGTAVVNDLNLRGTLRGRDAILDGTLDVKQLNVTEDMAAQIVSAMTVNTKKLVVTEAAVMQHVTAIEGIITPKIEASEGRFNTLLAGKASIEDIEAGNLTLTGHFRSGAVGKPGVIIPKNYTTYEGQEQLGVWLAPDGKAPSLGSEMGMTAGIWLDTASNKAGSTNSSPLNIRGQGGRGTRMWGDLQILPASNSRANIHSNTDLGIISTRGDLWGQGTALHYVARDGDMSFLSYGKGGSEFQALGSGDMVLGSTTNINLNASQDLNLRGFRDVLLKSGNNIKFFRPNNSPYINSWTAGGLKTVYMGGSSGTIYTDTSSRRFKVDIETAKPDHEWLDMRTVTYRDLTAVELKAEIEARRAAGDCTPLTAEEHERLAIADQVIPGRIAEEGVGVADAQVVLDGSGQVESWDYSRDAVMLTPHVREHRDKIADLEARIAELESALL